MPSPVEIRDTRINISQEVAEVELKSIQMTGIEQYLHVVLFIMLYKVVLTLKSVDETLVCDNFRNETYRLSSTFMWYCLSCCATTKFVDETPGCDHSSKSY